MFVSHGFECSGYLFCGFTVAGLGAAVGLGSSFGLGSLPGGGHLWLFVRQCGGSRLRLVLVGGLETER